MAIEAGETTYHQAKRGIVQNGLILNLDAAVDASYDGGTAWRDLEGGNNGTLTNGPTFDRDNGGSIALDGTNDLVDCGNITELNNANEYSVFVWLKFISGKYYGKLTSRASGAVLDMYSGNNNTHLIIIDPVGSKQISSYFSASVGTELASGWTFVSFTYKSGDYHNWYKNGQNIYTASRSTAQVSTSSNSFIVGNRSDAARPIQGNIATVNIYNRALSATEVLQNYNATKGRYA